ncbi:MAG: hypothetical protein PHD48_08735 [Alphaproteobacteria bacterium]|nr:hypothetical protein [Alphaproteobacteria bacterium]
MTNDSKKGNKGIKGGLPSLIVRSGGMLDSLRRTVAPQKENIPNASLIYGVASAILFAIALYYLFTGLWFTAILVMIVAGALFGYALVYLRFFG